MHKLGDGNIFTKSAVDADVILLVLLKSSLTSPSALDNNKHEQRRLNRQENSDQLSVFSTCKVLSCQVDYLFYFWLVTSSTFTFYYSLYGIMVCYPHCRPPTKLAFISSNHLM